MIKVHHLSNSHSHVVLWLLEELGVDYLIEHHQRDPVSGRSPDTLRRVHPLAKAPTIEDQGVTMIESTGILLYLLERYGEGRLRPLAGSVDAMRFLQWLTFMEGSGKPPIISFFRLAGAAADDPRRATAEQAAAGPFGLIEDALAGEETIVPGMFTAADIQLTFIEEVLEAFGQLEARPNMRAHLERMRSRDAYRRAEQMGGPVGMMRLFSGIR